MRWLLLAFVLLAAAPLGLSRPAQEVPPSALAQANLSPFTHVVYIIMENRSTDQLFGADTALVNKGFNAQLTAQLLGWQTVSSSGSPCVGNTLPVGCYQVWNYPLTHVPFSYTSPSASPSPSSYDMCHTHGCFQQEASNNAVSFRKAYYSCSSSCSSSNQGTGSLNPNTGWGDDCQETAGITPCNGNSLGNCTNNSANCSGNCPSPTPIPPTPTPFPNSSPTPSPFPSGALCGLAYLASSDVQPYWDIAAQYAIADNSYQTNQSPSFPSHQYAASGAAWATAVQSTSQPTIGPGVPGPPLGNGGISYATTGQRTNFYAFINNLAGDASGQTGCDAPSIVSTPTPLPSVSTLDLVHGGRGSARPCSPALSMFDELNTAGVTFKYYASIDNPPIYASYRNALDAFANWGCLYNGTPTPTCGSNFTNHFGLEQGQGSGQSQVLTDIANCNLAQMSWVTPTSLESDHAGVTDGTGPAYVAAIVNAIGESTCPTPYWQNTVIFITWDDWGGWYDHVGPQIFNKGEDGFRVPLIAVSAYTKPQYISHTQHEIFGSVLRFCEELFGLPSMQNTDARSDDLSDMFNYAQPPLSFVPIVANLPNMPKEGVLAVRDPKTGNWLDKDYRAVIRYITRKEANDHACVDECTPMDNR